MKNKKNIYIIIGVLVLLGIIGNLIKKDDKPIVIDAVKPKIEDQCDMAKVILKPYVKEQLEAPETASFPWTDYKCRYTGDSLYFVQSTVSFKNLNNVSLIKTYQITIKFNGGEPASNSNWQLIKLQWLD